MTMAFDAGNTHVTNQDNEAGTVLASGALTGTQTSADLTNDNKLGVHVVLDVTEVTAGVNEVQNVLVNATGGTFTLTYAGQTTSALAFDADPAAYETALRALSNIGDTDVAISGTPGNINVTFQGALAAQNVATMTSDATSLTGGAQTATVSTTTPGSPGSSITLTIKGKDSTSGKYYTLLAGAAVTTVSTNVYKVFPGIVAATNAAANDVVPKTFQILVTDNNTLSTTYSVGYSLVG